jgi:hypothetical protein
MIYIIDVVLTQEFLFTILQYRHNYKMGRHGCDRMVVGFTTTYMYRISAYHHWYEFESRSGRGVQRYVIKFVSDLPQVGWFSPGPMVSSKLNWPPDITEIMFLIVASNTIKQTNNIKQNRSIFNFYYNSFLTIIALFILLNANFILINKQIHFTNPFTQG